MTFPLTNFLFNRRHLRRAFRELSRAQWTSAAELERIQREKLSRQLEYAAAWIPFYQRRFRECGFDPREFQTLEDLQRVPPLRREDLVRHHRELVDARLLTAIDAAERRGPSALGKPLAFAPFRRHRLVRRTSSGSTGEPVVFYEDGSTSAASWAFESLFKQWFGIPAGASEVRLMRLATEHMPRARIQTLRRRLWRQIALPGINLAESDYATCFETIQNFQPAVLWGFTSALRGLAEFMLANSCDLDRRPQLIVTWAEPMHEYEEEVLKRAFDCPATNLYSSHEVGHIACRCPAGSFHVNQGQLLIEIDPETPGCEPGTGELIITTLFESPMPFLRYRMGDVGRIGTSACACGRQLQTIESLLGRTYELYTTRDGRMLSPNFWLHLFRRDHVAGFIKRFQVTYRKDDSIMIDVVKKEGSSSATDRPLRDLVAQNLGNETPVHWQYVDSIAAEPSGKVPIVRFEK